MREKKKRSGHHSVGQPNKDKNINKEIDTMQKPASDAEKNPAGTQLKEEFLPGYLAQKKFFLITL